MITSFLLSRSHFKTSFGANFADFCQKALSEVAREILNCLRALARVFKI